MLMGWSFLDEMKEKFQYPLKYDHIHVTKEKFRPNWFVCYPTPEFEQNFDITGET